MADSDPRELVALAQSGHREAFDRLVDATHAMAYATAYRLTGDPDLASDAIQQAYVRAWSSLHKFRRSSSFSTWLYRIVVNASLDALRERTRRPEPLSTYAGDDQAYDPGIVDPSGDPQAAAERRERQEVVQRALLQLSDDHRAVLVLFDLNGLSYEQIAEVLGVPLGTVKSRINRARLALRDVIEPGGELFGQSRSRNDEGNTPSDCR